MEDWYLNFPSNHILLLYSEYGIPPYATREFFMIKKVKSTWTKACKWVLKRPTFIKLVLNMAIFIVAGLFGVQFELGLPMILMFNINIKQ